MCHFPPFYIELTPELLLTLSFCLITNLWFCSKFSQFVRHCSELSQPSWDIRLINDDVFTTVFRCSIIKMRTTQLPSSRPSQPIRGTQANTESGGAESRGFSRCMADNLIIKCCAFNASGLPALLLRI